MKISRQEDYALTLVSVLAKGGDTYIPLSKISRALRLPGPFLKKIAMALKKAGLICVKEGRGGGYRLTRPTTKISVEEILEPFNPRPSLATCTSGGNFCDKYAICKTRQTWQYISQKFHDDLKKITLAEMLKKS